MHAPISPFIPFTSNQPAENADDLEMLCARDYPAQPVEWLWPGKIPIGKVTLLVGDPGLGKSLVALDVAARVSRGAAWPQQNVESQGTRVESQNSASGPQLSTIDSRPSSVLVLSAEDDLADTIRPRLDALDADPDRVFILPSIADLRHDLSKLRAAVDRAPNCRLIIVDPINAYVGPSDSHFHSVVRRVLAPLARLATEKQIAILAVTHLRKNDGAAIYRAAGSMGFVAAARAVWTVCRDHDNPGRSLLLPLKNNLAATPCGMAYSIESHPRLDAPVIRWRTEAITTPATVALRPAPILNTSQSAERAEARKWLHEALSAGPRPAREVISEGELRGFLRRTLQRAFHELNGHTAKRGLLEGWWWSLVDPAAADRPVESKPDPKTADIFEDVTYERDTHNYEQDMANQAVLDRLTANLNPFDMPPATFAESPLTSPTSQMPPAKTPKAHFDRPTATESNRIDCDETGTQHERDSDEDPNNPDPLLRKSLNLNRKLLDALKEKVTPNDRPCPTPEYHGSS